MTRVSELFGIWTGTKDTDWKSVVQSQICPFDDTKCFKTRKSEPAVSIGTCTVEYRRPAVPIMICPKRLLDGGRIFTDCLHLLTKHEPGNEYHLLPEVGIPGGSVDFILASVKGGSVVDFVGVELQTLDTTGTVWPERQRFLMDAGVLPRASVEAKPYGMNWKHTAKTILVQMHHKAATFSHVHRHLVLVSQEQLLSYMESEFVFDHFTDPADLVDTFHIHSYAMQLQADQLSLSLARRISTDVAGVQRSLGLQSEAVIEENVLLRTLSERVSQRTLFNPISRPLPDSVLDAFGESLPE